MFLLSLVAILYAVVPGPKMRMRGHRSLKVPVSCTIGKWSEKNGIKGPGLHLVGYTLCNMFAKNDIEEAGTRLPVGASILVGVGMLTKNRIPVHYIKRHAFWGRVLSIYLYSIAYSIATSVG